MEEIVYLLGTIVIEVPVALLLLRKEKWQRVLFVCIAINTVTHPIAWIFLLGGANWLGIEICVAVFETTVFACFFRRFFYQAAIIALLMNILSAAAGFLFSYTISLFF